MKHLAFAALASLIVMAAAGCAPQIYRRNAVVVEVLRAEPSEHRSQACESVWPETLGTIGSLLSTLLNRNCTLCQAIGVVREAGLIGGSVTSDLIRQAANANIRAHRIVVPVPDGGGPYTVETTHAPDGSVTTRIAPSRHAGGAGPPAQPPG